MCTIETAQAEVSAAVRAALAGDAPDLSPQQISNRLWTMMGSDQRRTDLDAAVRTLTQAVGRAIDESDVARLVAHGHQRIHDEVATIALCWGYDADAAKRLASRLVTLVLVTLGYADDAPSRAEDAVLPGTDRVVLDPAAARSL
ncbi:hypothetical protein BOX37_19955 [Nocardia mangyaensis]|uniref:Uncharacterized protein n=1 Tax=Nocardia mangyaensis TaxID=2213200 RepID=A0A1J0VUZ3_9NOCA|nr:hypothetical protein [Nocardia mangyaensis]APE35845.1 hypothetical protein BOX37_19955 [Nocardia mangyaensis]